MQKAKGTQSRGFTLIEVLVVVAIIALLVSILLPSLRRAREMSTAVVLIASSRAASGLAVHEGTCGRGPSCPLGMPARCAAITRGLIDPTRPKKRRSWLRCLLDSLREVQAGPLFWSLQFAQVMAIVALLAGWGRLFALGAIAIQSIKGGWLSRRAQRLEEGRSRLDLLQYGTQLAAAVFAILAVWFSSLDLLIPWGVLQMADTMVLLNRLLRAEGSRHPAGIAIPIQCLQLAALACAVFISRLPALGILMALQLALDAVIAVRLYYSPNAPDA